MSVAAITFKPDLYSHHDWLGYCLILCCLLGLAIFLAYQYSKRKPLKLSCTVIEKRHLSSKTVLYVIEYQQQRFLLVDNQQALLWHPIEVENTYVSV